MDHDSLYDTDICSWAEQQAAALRSLASKTDLPNQLDLPNIIEEIEDVGNNHLASVNSFVRLILTHLILAAADQDASSMRHWAAEVASFHVDLMLRYTHSMRQRVDIERLWARALKVAQVKLEEYHLEAHALAIRRGATFASWSCPFEVDDICDEAFEFHVAVQRLSDQFPAASS
jgi:hypothetical protein